MAQVIAVPYDNLKTGVVTQRYFAFVFNAGLGAIQLNSSVDGGVTWTSVTLSGGPPSGFVGTAPAATAFFSGNLTSAGAAINQFYVFAVGNDHHLWLNVSLNDGETWNWQDQGALTGGASIANAPDSASIEVVGTSLEYDVYCYVVGSDGHLYVNYSENSGKSWNWAKRGAPSGVKLASQPSALAYFDGTNLSFYAFAVGNDKNLYANVGDGSVWNWHNLGQPIGGVENSGGFQPTALTVPPDAAKEIYAFVVGTDGNLHAVYSPAGGTGWKWENLGPPPGGVGFQTFVPNALRAAGVETKSGAFSWPVYVFAVGGDYNLYMNSSPDASLGLSAAWSWQGLGQPSGSPPLMSLIGTVSSTEVEASVADEQFYAFVYDIEYGVNIISWDGSTWSWLP